jgi:DNA-binding MarR family transcriptional regulator/DNA-binding PadR family transcriptional regulator
MPFKYTLTFSSHGVDESALRSAIESLGVLNLTIARMPAGVPESASSALPKISNLQQKILGILSDNVPHRKYEIVEAIGDQGHAGETTKALDVLVTAGLARRFKHGIYGSPQASEVVALALPPRMNKSTADTTYGKVVRMIKEHPVTAVQIREKFEVSRQRVEQILSKAEERGQIRRVETSGERGQYLYLSADAALSEIMERTPELSESRRRLLSSMAPGELYYATGLTAFLDKPNTSQLKSWILGLAKWGLVYHFTVGVKMFCGITPLGIAYPDYDSSIAKATPVAFVSELGEIKSRFLQAMKLLGGTAKTIELTYALGEEIFGDAGYSSGQVMQRLQKSGLVEHASAKKHKEHRAYRLTRTGEYVASVVDRFLPPPSRQLLKQRIEERLQLKSEKLRGVWGGYSLPPTYRAILTVIVEEKQILTQSIPSKMGVKFANPKSISLAVKSMEERGYIFRSNNPSKSGIVWQATEKGLLEAQSMNEGNRASLDIA